MGNAQKVGITECYSTCPSCLEASSENNNELDASKMQEELRGRVHRVFGKKSRYGPGDVGDEVTEAAVQVFPVGSGFRTDLATRLMQERDEDEGVENEGSVTTLGSFLEGRKLGTPRVDAMQYWSPPVTPTVTPRRLGSDHAATTPMDIPEADAVVHELTGDLIVARTAFFFEASGADDAVSTKACAGSMDESTADDDVAADDEVEVSQVGWSRVSSWSLPGEEIGKLDHHEHDALSRGQSIRPGFVWSAGCESVPEADNFGGFQEAGTLDDEDDEDSLDVCLSGECHEMSGAALLDAVLSSTSATDCVQSAWAQGNTTASICATPLKDEGIPRFEDSCGMDFAQSISAEGHVASGSGRPTPRNGEVRPEFEDHCRSALIAALPERDKAWCSASLVSEGEVSLQQRDATLRFEEDEHDEMSRKEDQVSPPRLGREMRMVSTSWHLGESRMLTENPF